MNLDCVAQILINAGLGAAQGVDIFQHFMPETAPDGAMLLRLPMEGIPINHYVMGLFKGRFQVILRSKSLAFGEARAPLINKALYFGAKTFVDSSGAVLMRTMNCYSTTLPIVYPRSIGNQYEWSCNFLAHYLLPDPASVALGGASGDAIVVSG